MRAFATCLLVVSCGGVIGVEPDAGPDAASVADVVAVDAGDACTSAPLHVDVVDGSGSAAIAVSGSPGTLGFADPSFYTSSGPEAYLTLSAIEGSGARWLLGATATDGGTQFFGGSAHGSSSYPCDAGDCLLVLGPATTVIDPGAQIGASSKTFTQVYLLDPSASPPERYGRGYIARSDDYGFAIGAPTPNIRWSDEPFVQTAFTDLRMFAQLSACTAFGEPTAISRSSSMDLALTCETSVGKRVVLLRSTDHAQSFAYVSTLLDEQDAAALGGSSPIIESPELFDAGGQSYLIVSTRGALGRPDACVTVELASPEAVARDCASHPIVTRRIVEKNQLSFGSCTFSPQEGYFASVRDDAASPPFRVVATGITLP